MGDWKTFHIQRGHSWNLPPHGRHFQLHFGGLTLSLEPSCWLVGAVMVLGGLRAFSFTIHSPFPKTFPCSHRGPSTWCSPGKNQIFSKDAPDLPQGSSARCIRCWTPSKPKGEIQAKPHDPAAPPFRSTTGWTSWWRIIPTSLARSRSGRATRRGPCTC